MDLQVLRCQRCWPEQVQTANAILILVFIPLVNYVIYPAIGPLLSR